MPRPTPPCRPSIRTRPDSLPPTVTGITAIVAPKDSLGPNMLMLSALLLVLASAGVLVVAKIILGLLLLLGPLVRGTGAIFRDTRSDARLGARRRVDGVGSGHGHHDDRRIDRVDRAGAWPTCMSRQIRASSRFALR